MDGCPDTWVQEKVHPALGPISLWTRVPAHLGWPSFLSYGDRTVACPSSTRLPVWGLREMPVRVAWPWLWGGHRNTWACGIQVGLAAPWAGQSQVPGVEVG